MYKFHKDHTEPANAGAIFVFGSNLAARHGGGAAKLAADKYGASKDVAEGISGSSYAIPTKDEKIETLPLDAVRFSVLKFIAHAQANPEVEFFMTRIGCVLAGYSNAEIAPMFMGSPENIDFPKEWKEFIGEEEIVTSYKGFDANLKCRDMQYTMGETAIHEGNVEACAGGLHACSYPLDVFRYYSPNNSRFAIVEQSGNLSRHEEDSKVASRKLTLKAEIGIPGIIKAAIEYTMSRTLPVDKKSPAYAEADYGAASATGTRGAASATGEKSIAMASGRFGKAKAENGCAIFLTYRDINWNILHARAAIVGKDGVKPNVWYSLNEAGEIFEVE